MNNRPGILFVMHMPPPVHGASMVGKYIHDSKLINETFDCHYIDLTTAKDLMDIGKLKFRKLKQVGGLLRTIHREVKRLKPELVYVTPNACGGAFYKDFFVVQMLKAMGCKVVAHYHNKGVSTKQEHFFDNLLYKRFFEGIKVMLLAEPLYGDISKYVKRENVVVCGNGIPDFFIGDDSTRGLGIPHLLFLSNMMKTKGVWELLDALCVLRKQGIDFVCDFVGGWKDIQPGEFHARVHEYGLSECVHAHGAKYGMEKEAFFYRADIFVFPTYYHNECFPLVLLEAMMHGLACVSTNEGGISSIIENGETGIIVERKNSQELADALGELLSNRSRCKSMGRAGQRRYRKEFTLQRFEERFCECLQTLV